MVWLTAILLMAVQVVQVVIVLHSESLTFDEEDHMYAGYRMWKICTLPPELQTRHREVHRLVLLRALTRLQSIGRVAISRFP
jgi:hypothetical protein